ncbi:MAG TPA: hypothetical protein VKZ67_12320 [Natronosporangium sp.]|nr:hypothetical protein [Natronosporangium sp.]
MTWYRPARQERRYRRMTRRAFATVTFYREQLASAGEPLPHPRPTPVGELPDPPHTLVPFARPWSARYEPSLWTPRLRPLAAALRLAGCRGRRPVLEVRPALWDGTRLPGGWPRRRYAVLLPATAQVASPERRAELNQAALTAIGDGPAWVVGAPEELADLPARPGLAPVARLPIQALEAAATTETRPAVLYEPRLGYLGARVPGCGRWHLDWSRVHAQDRGGQLTLSRLDQRRPTLLEVVVPGADRVTVERCPTHRTPVLRVR